MEKGSFDFNVRKTDVCFYKEKEEANCVKVK